MYEGLLQTNIKGKQPLYRSKEWQKENRNVELRLGGGGTPRILYIGEMSKSGYLKGLDHGSVDHIKNYCDMINDSSSGSMPFLTTREDLM